MNATTAKNFLTDTIPVLQTVHDSESQSSLDGSLLLHPENLDLIKMGWGGMRHGAGRKPKLYAAPSRLIGPRWYVVEALHREIHTACRAIIEHGFEAFLPTDAVRVPVKRPAPGEPKFTVVHRPMFFQFLFVRFDVDHDQWAGIRYQDGVKRIFMTTQQRPVAVERGLVERLIDTAPDRLMLPETGLPKIKPETPVLVVRGPFNGHVVHVESCDGISTVAWVGMFGGHTKVTLRRSDLSDE